jgi:hypothetical protein
VIIFALIGTPAALLSGATAVTVGANPVMPSWPHPAAKALISNTMNHVEHLE